MLQNDRCFSECKPLLNFEEINILQNLEREEMSTTSFNDSTIITEDNMYEVFEYLGLDTSSIREVDSDTLETVTVGELRERIKVWEESPRYTCVIAYPDAKDWL